MQTATEIHALIERVYAEGRVELSGVSWDEYDALPKKREPIYAALGVPELWRIKKGRIIFCALRSGKYIPMETSLAFPRLKSDDMNRYFELWRSVDDLEGQDAFRKWVRETLKPNA